MSAVSCLPCSRACRERYQIRTAIHPRATATSRTTTIAGPTVIRRRRMGPPSWVFGMARGLLGAVAGRVAGRGSVCLWVDCRLGRLRGRLELIGLVGRAVGQVDELLFPLQVARVAGHPEQQRGTGPEVARAVGV